MRLFRYLSLMLLCASAAAQSLSVTATITDSDAQTWNNGTWSVQLYAPSGQAFYNGTPVSQIAQTGTMSGGGALAVTLNNTSTIAPTGAAYTWTLCSQTSAQCSVFNTPVTTTNLSSLLSGLVIAPRFPAGPASRGYIDVEVSPVPPNGGSYYSSINNCLRVWTGSWNCSGGGASLPTATAAGQAPVSTGPGTAYTAQSVVPAATLPQNATQLNNRRIVTNLVGNLPGLWSGNQNVSAGNFTSKETVTISGRTQNMQICFTGATGGSGGVETTLANNLILQAAIAFPGTTTNGLQFSTQGQTEWVMDRNAAINCTDVLGFFAPAGTTSAVLSVYQRVPIPPTVAASATGFSEGHLAASTAYFYKATCFDYWESGPSSSATATTGTSTLAIALNITPPNQVVDVNGNTICKQYGIYRSLTSGGTYNIIATVPANSLGNTRFYDTGTLGSTSAVPPAASRSYYNAHITNGSNINVGVAPVNQVLAPTTSSYTGYARDTVFLPQIIASDDTSQRGWCASGTSRLSQSDVGGLGQLIPANDLYYGLSWFTRGMMAAGKTSMNIGMPSARLDYLETDFGRPMFRHAAMQFCQGVVSEMNINDILNGDTFATIAANKMQEAWGYFKSGISYFASTLEPVASDSADNFTTYTGQTPDPSTSVRTTYNDWLRAGACVSGEVVSLSSGTITFGTPVAATVTGTLNPTFTCPSGSSPTVLFLKTSTGLPLFFDTASTAECNSSGQGAAQGSFDGGYWCIPSGTPVTGTLQAATTVTAIQLASSITVANQYSGYVVKITSGAATGQMAIVQFNDATANATLLATGNSWPGAGGSAVGLSTLPAAGDSYQLVRLFTTDGLHGTTGWNRDISGPAFATFLTTKLPNPY